MAETPPNTPQRVRVAAQQLDRSNRTLDSPQRRRTPHQAVPPLIPPLRFEVPPPVGGDPFAVAPVVGGPVNFNGHQYHHLPQHLAQAVRNLQPNPPGDDPFAVPVQMAPIHEPVHFNGQ